MLVFGGVLSTTKVIRQLDCDMSTPRYVQIFESAAGDDGTVSLSELQDEPASWYVKMKECGFICRFTTSHCIANIHCSHKKHTCKYSSGKSKQISS